MEILKLYEQSKALNAVQVGAVNHDSGISSAPSSAGESVSSTDTNHGGSDEDLIDFNQSWRHSRYDNWPPGKTSYTPLFWTLWMLISRGAMVEQGWRSVESTRLLPIWPGFKTRHPRHMWFEFVVGLLQVVLPPRQIYSFMLRGPQ